MSITQVSREELISQLNQAVQESGNLTVLFTNAIASRIGLSATEFECLSLLREGPLSAGRLAELCGLTTGALTGLIDRLEKAGYARRQPDPSDRRKVMVEAVFCIEMRHKVQALYAPLEKAFNELVSSYTEEELALVLGYVLRSTAAVRSLTLGDSQ